MLRRNFVRLSGPRQCKREGKEERERERGEGRKNNNNESDSGSESKSERENMKCVYKVSTKVRDSLYINVKD